MGHTHARVRILLPLSQLLVLSHMQMQLLPPTRSVAVLVPRAAAPDECDDGGGDGGGGGGEGDGEGGGGSVGGDFAVDVVRGGQRACSPILRNMKARLCFLQASVCAW